MIFMLFVIFTFYAKCHSIFASSYYCHFKKFTFNKAQINLILIEKEYK